VPDSRIEQARSFLLTEADLSPREDWEAAIDPAMPKAQRQLQLELVDAYLSGDVYSIIEHAHADVEIVQAPELPGARSYHGRKGMLEALLDWPLQWERFVLTPRRIFAVDDEWVLTVALHSGRARIGLDVEAELVWAVRWRNRLISRWETYMTVEAALGAVASAGSDNAQVVRRWFSRFAEGEAGVELCDPAVRIDNVAGFPITGPYYGHDGVRQWWDDLQDAIDELHIELEELRAVDGERVATSQRLVGRYRHTGIRLDVSWASIVSVSDGKIVRAVGYGSLGQALKAAGSPP
jgi:ketosteroid isomerase-like protein